MGAAISFAGKHVVITGGSEGIGLALADRFLADGATVSIVSRSQSKLDDARADLLVRTQDLRTVLSVSCDERRSKGCIGVTRNGASAQACCDTACVAARWCQRIVGPVSLAPDSSPPAKHRCRRQNVWRCGCAFCKCRPQLADSAHVADLVCPLCRQSTQMPKCTQSQRMCPISAPSKRLCSACRRWSVR